MTLCVEHTDIVLARNDAIFARDTNASENASSAQCLFGGDEMQYSLQKWVLGFLITTISPFMRELPHLTFVKLTARLDKGTKFETIDICGSSQADFPRIDTLSISRTVCSTP